MLNFVALIKVRQFVRFSTNSSSNYKYLGRSSIYCRKQSFDTSFTLNFFHWGGNVHVLESEELFTYVNNLRFIYIRLSCNIISKQFNKILPPFNHRSNEPTRAVIHPRHVDYTFRAALINFTLHHRTIRSRSIQRDIEIHLTILPRADKKFHLEARGANIRRSRWLLKLLPRGDYAGVECERSSERGELQKYAEIRWSASPFDSLEWHRNRYTLFRSLLSLPVSRKFPTCPPYRPRRLCFSVFNTYPIYIAYHFTFLGASGGQNLTKLLR